MTTENWILRAVGKLTQIHPQDTVKLIQHLLDIIFDLLDTLIYNSYNTSSDWLESPIVDAHKSLTKYKEDMGLERQSTMTNTETLLSLIGTDEALELYYEQEANDIPPEDRIALTPEQQRDVDAWHWLLEQRHDPSQTELPTKSYIVELRGATLLHLMQKS